MVVLSMDLWRYRKPRVDAVPIPMRVLACPTGPSLIMCLRSICLGHQCRWEELNLRLETLWLG